MNLYCLHGFLGTPNDWLPLELYSIPSVNPVYVDLFNEPALRSNSLWDWADKFNAFAADSQKERSLLLGYSMGGRLALHALLKNPTVYRGAIIVSANPGLSNFEEKRLRFERDLRWAKAFEAEPWENLMAKWNFQPVFLSDDVIPRCEESYCRTTLSRALINWSLGEQDDLKDRLSELDLPILWAAGRLDSAYSKLAQKLSFKHKLSQVWIAEECGHRLPWQNTKEFKEQLANFTNAITTSEGANANSYATMGNNKNLSGYYF